jgi:hypothetical protein
MLTYAAVCRLVREEKLACGEDKLFRPLTYADVCRLVREEKLACGEDELFRALLRWAMYRVDHVLLQPPPGIFGR